MNANSERFHGLDALRAFALLLGVVFHSSLSYLLPPGLWAVAPPTRPRFLAGSFITPTAFWRPIIGTVVGKFLACGDLQQGFARVGCPKCREEFFVAYSCRVRCFCPSCHEKRALEKAGWVAEHVCAEVPHRQFVFTIPKRLRIYFRFERRLLGQLFRAAARTVTTVYQSASGRPDAVPGVVGAIQTFGQLAHWHPHIHAVVSEGVFPTRPGWLDFECLIELGRDRARRRQWSTRVRSWIASGSVVPP
jgi:hypothetical protein